MEYLWMSVLMGLVTFLIAVYLFRFKKKSSSDNSEKFRSQLIPTEMNNAVNSPKNELIQIERLPSTVMIEDKALFEIKDKMIIAQISESIPKAAEAMAKTINKKAFADVELYKVIIPSGTSLVDSKQMDGAFRGLFRGQKGIKGHANLVKVDPTKISKAGIVANGAANALSVGSLVVGQYYMTEINSKLETMCKSISQISDFQDREFKSRILSLIARVEKISAFSSEILENNDLRYLKLQTLEDLEGEGIQLLQQVNLTVSDIMNNNPKNEYKVYQLKVEEFGLLAEYQQLLMSLLEEISKLTYLLGKGEISTEMGYSIYFTYLNQTNQVRTNLEKWHDTHAELLGIDMDKNRIAKNGFDRVIAKLPGLVNDNINYRELKPGLVQKVNSQKISHQSSSPDSIDFYNQDVQIIIREGKYYYLKDSMA